MNITIQILLILVLLDILFARHIKATFISIMKNRKKKLNKPVRVEEYEKRNPNIPPHLLHFISGQRNSWNLTRIAIYKMYLDGELLDYESLIHGIYKRLQTFTDQKLVDSLGAQLEYYIQESNKPTPAAIEPGKNNGEPPLSSKPVDPIPPETF